MNCKTFTAPAGATNTRFSLKYQKTLGIKSLIFNEKNIVLYKRNEKIFIKSGGSPIDNVKVFDIGGGLLVEKTKVNVTETGIESSKFSGQVLIFKIASAAQAVAIKNKVN